MTGLENKRRDARWVSSDHTLLLEEAGSQQPKIQPVQEIPYLMEDLVRELESEGGTSE